MIDHALNMTRNIGQLFLLILLLLGGYLYYSEVDNSITEEEIFYITKFVPEKLDGASLSYENQVLFIENVLSAVLLIASDNIGIKQNRSREPRDLFKSKSGLCYDRSRVIEKILRYNGFRTRHVSVFSMEGFDSITSAFLSKGISSHAVSEVLTRKGWMLIDSNSIWLSRDLNGNPMSVATLMKRVRAGLPPDWLNRPETRIYDSNFFFVYGLYSRHGKFYPPYNSVPDVNYSEFADNLFGN